MFFCPASDANDPFILDDRESALADVRKPANTVSVSLLTRGQVCPLSEKLLWASITEGIQYRACSSHDRVRVKVKHSLNNQQQYFHEVAALIYERPLRRVHTAGHISLVV